MSLELLLAALLVATLVLGVRLERKLRALRDSQSGFVKALGELDGAASRTETGLAKLRQATDEARGELTPRIEAAQSVAARLEQLTREAELAAKRAEAAAREVDACASKLASAIARPRVAAEPPPPPKLPPPDEEPIRFRAPADEEPLRLRPGRVSEGQAVRLEREPQPEPKRGPVDFAALLAAKTTRQPLPTHTADPAHRSEPAQAGSRLREAAALLRGG